MSRLVTFGAVFIFVIGAFGLGYWLGGNAASDVSVTGGSRPGCYVISVDADTKREHHIVKDDQKTELEPGESIEVCQPFELYESIPVHWDPDD